MEDYKMSALIGVGSFGRVYKAFRKEDGQVVAIKVITKMRRSNTEMKNLRRECVIQAKLKHPNVITMLGSFETKNDLIVVTEYAYTDLNKYLSRVKTMNENSAQKLICQLISALYYLHSNRILHRDLKPQNVLLSEDMHAKLCDFGLARNMTTSTHMLTSIKGTPLYMAPELLAARPYDHLADLWSLGCISYEVLNGQPPFCAPSIMHLVKLIKYEEVKWLSTLSSDCRSLLQGLLEKDPAMRISWTQILCHPFVEDKLYIAKVQTEITSFTNETGVLSNALNESNTSSKAVNETLLSESLAKLKFSLDAETKNDNLTSSRDSINAIPPSDIEFLETDVEDNANKVIVPFTEISYKAPNRHINLTKLANEASMPVVNSQTCFVSGNSNMILNHLNDNFPAASNNVTPLKDNAKTKLSKQQQQPTVLQKSRNRDLEKRKLSQNLENFSLRLGQTHETEQFVNIRKERAPENIEPKNSTNALKDSADEKRSTENSPPCLLPGWDSCDESQNPPIENDEWLAFLNRTMQEILDGEVDSLKEQNLVSIIVAPLRNSKATPKVVETVAQLLSLPFVLSECSGCIFEQIKTVYVDVKLVPNLMYASKLLVYQKSTTNESSASLTQQTRFLRPMSNLSNEEISTLSRLYELICHLVHLRHEFLLQFCDAVAILAANDLLINLLSHDFKNSQATRIANNVIALFCCVLREMPENAELVEKIVFHESLPLVALLQSKNDTLRLRLCRLFRLLTRFSLRGLQTIWSSQLKQRFEALANDAKSDVQKEAEVLLSDLRQFSFYS